MSALGNAFSHVASRLGTLDISHNPLGSVGAAYLAEPLKKATKLNTLIVNACQLGYRLSTDDGDIRKGQVRNSIPVLDGRGLLTLFQALRYNTTLVALSVRDNWCGGGDHALEKRILSDKGARSSGARATLNRHSSNIQDQLANAIARQIDKTTLTHLDIGLLGLGARGLLAIANALIKGSGVRDVERVLAKHHIALSKFEKREQNVEIELARRQEKLCKLKLLCKIVEKGRARQRRCKG